MAEPLAQQITWTQYADVVVRVTMDTNGSIAGKTFEFTARSRGGTLAFRKSSDDGITITDAGSPTTPGVITIAPSSTDTALPLPGGGHGWDLWRTNEGEQTQIAFGELAVRAQQRR